MEAVYWILAAPLAGAFLGAGLFKLIYPKPVLRDKGMAWVEDFSDTGVKGIAAVEVAGAIGVLLPPLTGVAPILAPIAAAALAAHMTGAILVHRRRREGFVPPLVLGTLAVATAALGFLVWA